MGWAKDPEADMNRVYEAKLKRMEAAMKGSTGSGKAIKADKEEDEEEEEEEAAPAEDDDEEGGAAPAEDAEEKEGEEEDVPAAEDGDEEEEEGAAAAGDEEGDEDEESALQVAPLYLPTKGKKLSMQEVWDNFTVKAVKYGEDDDDDDEDEEEGTVFVFCSFYYFRPAILHGCCLFWAVQITCCSSYIPSCVVLMDVIRIPCFCVLIRRTKMNRCHDHVSPFLWFLDMTRHVLQFLHCLQAITHLP
jgi:hypothetical protein